MKNLIKSRIFAFILGAIIFGSVGVIAANYAANEIDFTPEDTTWKKQDGSDIKTVQDALDDLYSIPRGITKDATIEEITRSTSSASETTITNVNRYKCYYVTNIWTNPTEFNLTNGMNYLQITSTNSNILNLGDTYYLNGNWGALSRSYLIFPDDSGNDIKLTIHGDGMTLYGIK